MLQWETELITLLYTLDAIRCSLNILECTDKLKHRCWCFNISGTRAGHLRVTYCPWCIASASRLVGWCEGIGIYTLQMDYINTSHPNFIGGSKAAKIPLQQQWGTKVVPMLTFPKPFLGQGHVIVMQFCLFILLFALKFYFLRFFLRIGDLRSTQDFSIWNLVSIRVVDFTNTQICGWNKAQRLDSFADNSDVPTLLTLNLESFVSAYAILVPYKLTHVCMYMWYMIHLTFKLDAHMDTWSQTQP